MENKKKLITKLEKSENIILNANYIFFDPLLWTDAHYHLKELGVKYELIGLDFFGDEKATPTLINLSLIGLEKKKELWVEIGSYTYTDAFSRYDQMSMFQNYIISNKDINTIKEFLAGMLKLQIGSEKYLFRMFDSRAMIHFSSLFNFRDNKPTTQIEKFELWQQNIDAWIISVADQFFKLNCPNNFFNDHFSQNISFDDMQKINENLRILMMPDTKNNNAEINSTLIFEDVLHNEYKKKLENK